MADFMLNDDQLQIQQWVHDFAANVIRPAGHEWDEREEFPYPIVQQAAEIIQKAREAGEAEQKRLMAELRKELSRLVVDTTAKVTGKILTSADQQKITSEANKELAA